MRQRGCWPGDGSGIGFRAAARTRPQDPVSPAILPGDAARHMHQDGTRPNERRHRPPPAWRLRSMARLLGAMAPGRDLLLGVGGEAPLKRAVNRGRHADNVFDAGVLCGDALNDCPPAHQASSNPHRGNNRRECRRGTRLRRGHGQMTQPRLTGSDTRGRLREAGCQKVRTDWTPRAAAGNGKP